MRLRDSVPDDAAAIARVQVRSSRQGFAGIFPAEALARLDPKPRVALWRERHAIVAEEDGAIVGLVHVGPSDESPSGRCTASSCCRGRCGTGVGQALMERALEQLRAAGFDEATLWVHADNPRARRFYEAGGWVFDGAEKDVESFDGILAKEVRYRITLR